MTTPDIAAMDEVLTVLDEFAAREAAMKEEEARRTLEHPNGVVVLEDQVWNQNTWRTLEEEWIDIDHGLDESPRCKTAMCFAGWRAELDPDVEWLVTPRKLYEARKRTIAASIALRAAEKAERESGFQPSGQEDALRASSEWRDARNALGGLLEEANLLVEVGDKTRDTFSVETWAQNRLGLAQAQADALFAGSNELAALHEVVDQLRENPEAYIDDVADDEPDEDDYEDEDEDA